MTSNVVTMAFLGEKAKRAIKQAERVVQHAKIARARSVLRQPQTRAEVQDYEKAIHNMDILTHLNPVRGRRETQQ